MPFLIYNVSVDLQYTTDATVRDFYVVFALKAAEGKLLYVTSCQPSCAGIKLSSSIKDSSTANSIVPATVEAIAYFIVEAE